MNSSLRAAEIAVVGAGSWGTALAKVLSDKGSETILWARRPDHALAIAAASENKEYLPGSILGARLETTDDLGYAVHGRKAVVMVVPSHGFREIFAHVAPALAPGAMVVSATKGIENETLLTMSQVMTEMLPAGKQCAVAVLSGPSFAKEVAENLPTAVTVASASLEVASYFQALFSTENFRVYSSTDVVGLELGGALKNVIALAAGISDGLGFGTNTRAALITRGLAEISRLGMKLGANPLTLSGLGGLGDLILTCTGDLSRNRTVGLRLGQGLGLADILAEMKMVAEGVKTTRSAFNLAQRNRVDMPITEQVYNVLYEGRSPAEAVRRLLSRDLKEELL